MPDAGSSDMPARWVVVVPLGDATLFEYLTKSFASVHDVRVVLERRRRRPASEVPAHDRGGKDRRSHPRVLSNFLCALIRRPAPVVLETPASPGQTSSWPHLRITDLVTWTEEDALRGTETRTAH